MMELQKIPLEDGSHIPFTDTTQNLGRAEFQICPQWRYGKLVKVSIYPAQQEKTNVFWEWEGGKKRHFTIQSYCGLDDPKVWYMSYCKEHKCQSIRVYVPNGSKFIWFSVFGDNLTIGFTNKIIK